MSSILMIILFKKALILQGEISCWSLSGLKGLSRMQRVHGVKPKPRELWDTAENLVCGSKIPTVANLDSPHVRNLWHSWILDSTPWIQDSRLCQWNSNSRFQSLVGSWIIPWAVFRIPKSRNPIPQVKISRIPESGFPDMGWLDDKLI